MTRQFKCAGVLVYYRLKVTFHAIGNYYQYFQFIFRLMNNEVMASLNMKGKGSKYAFGSTKVFQVVVGM